MITSKRYKELNSRSENLNQKEYEEYSEYQSYLERRKIQRMIRPIIKEFSWPKKDSFVARVISTNGTKVELKIAWNWNGESFFMSFDTSGKEFSFSTKTRPKAGDIILIHAPLDGSFVKLRVLPRKDYWRPIGFWET